LAGVFLLLLPIVYAAGVAGVARARCGEPYDWALWNRLAARINRGRERSRGPFRSAAGAQLWFECRALAWILPAFVILILFWVTSLLAMSPDDPGLTWRLLGAVILLPALVAQLMGISLAKQDIWSKYPMPAFMATRPITSLAMVRAKFGMAAVSALMCYIMLAIYLPLAFSLRPGAWQAIAQSVAATPAWKAAGIVAASFLTLVFITWTGLVSRMWLGFTGRPGLIGAYTSAVAAFWLAAVLAGSWIFYALPEWHAAIKAGVPWMIAALLLIKATAAGCVLGALHRSHVATAANIAAITVLWAAAVLLVFGIIYWLVPVEAISPLTILAAAALFIPLTRLCAAPLALAWNRHR